MKLKSLIKKLRAAGFSSVNVELMADDQSMLVATQPNLNRYPHEMRLALTPGSWWGDQDELDLRIREYNDRRQRTAA